MSQVDEIEDAAVNWVIALRDPGFADWDELTTWLEADLRHADVYGRIALIDADIPANDRVAVPAPAARRRWIGWAAGAALAASVAGVVALNPFSPASSDIVVATRAGEHRSVTLPDGSRVDLNGDTTLAYASDTPRQVRFERGEAVFTVHHDAAAPFTVTAGSAVVQDVGTVFNLARADDRVEVAVAQGSVMVNPAADRLLIPAGRSLVLAGGATAGVVDVASVGSWRDGRLVYRATTVGHVAADLARSIGEPVTPSADVAAQPFSGVIILDADRDRMFRRVGALLGVSAAHDGSGWRLAKTAG